MSEEKNVLGQGWQSVKDAADHVHKVVNDTAGAASADVKAAVDNLLQHLAEFKKKLES